MKVEFSRAGEVHISAHPAHSCNMLVSADLLETMCTMERAKGGKSSDCEVIKPTHCCKVATGNGVGRLQHSDWHDKQAPWKGRELTGAGLKRACLCCRI